MGVTERDRAVSGSGSIKHQCHPMQVDGDAWEWGMERLSSVTIDQHWSLTLLLLLPLGVFEALNSIETWWKDIREI